MNDFPSQVPSFYSVIPAHVRYNNEIEAGAKFLYAEITALTSCRGYCWATNRHFAKCFNVCERTIKRWMASLKKEKFIYTETGMLGRIRWRKIWLSLEAKKHSIDHENAKCDLSTMETSQNMFSGDKNVPMHGDKNVTQVDPRPYICINTEEIYTCATALALSFFERLQMINPKIKKPKEGQWEKDLIAMMEKDGHSEEDIRKVMNYVVSTKDKISTNGFKWCTVVLSAAKLRKHFVQLWGEIDQNQTASPNHNEQLTDAIKDKYFMRRDILFGHNYIEFDNQMTCENIKFEDKNFKEKVNKQLKKRGLEEIQ